MRVWAMRAAVLIACLLGLVRADYCLGVVYPLFCMRNDPHDPKWLHYWVAFAVISGVESSVLKLVLLLLLQSGGSSFLWIIIRRTITDDTLARLTAMVNALV